MRSWKAVGDAAFVLLVAALAPSPGSLNRPAVCCGGTASSGSGFP